MFWDDFHDYRHLATLTEHKCMTWIYCKAIYICFLWCGYTGTSYWIGYVDQPSAQCIYPNTLLLAITEITIIDSSDVFYRHLAINLWSVWELTALLSVFSTRPLIIDRLPGTIITASFFHVWYSGTGNQVICARMTSGSTTHDTIVVWVSSK